jgi:hypothetical protein
MYGCIYLLFEAYPIVFTEGHHLNAGISGLMFLPISIGGAFGCVVVRLFFMCGLIAEYLIIVTFLMCSISRSSPHATTDI